MCMCIYIYTYKYQYLVKSYVGYVCVYCVHTSAKRTTFSPGLASHPLYGWCLHDLAVGRVALRNHHHHAGVKAQALQRRQALRGLARPCEEGPSVPKDLPDRSAVIQGLR